MANISTDTIYQFLVQLPNAMTQWLGNLEAGDGMTDDLAVEIITALKGCAWPTGTEIMVTKQAITYDSRLANATMDPIAFQ